METLFTNEDARKEFRAAVREAMAPVAEMALLNQRLSVDEAEAALLLGVSHNTLRNWRGQKRGPGYSKVGAKVVYEVSKIRKWLEANGKKTIGC
ncbi:helix-turn-helix domain-containing protein [Maridesulfovibrio bastinii]|uniref:helix-turn-helix domain-containing protein n=1 Tax=Maridesulfovibrio bastinii TaxID=47157 RepID=UPI00040C728B|nr:helix-turn-helix domain-containing protein [Maridesulfovibrio bastinii]